MIELHNMDCMELMQRYPDDYFDLSIVDPPYGSKFDAINISNCKDESLQKAKRKKYKQFTNKAPSDNYFNELIRVSKNQIIWGVNFYKYNFAGGRICWDKHGTAFGRAELAFCSLISSVNVFDYTWNGMIQGDMKNKEQRIHPTQKPIALYRWLLDNYAKQGDKILDTHLGSGSSAIAAYQLGYDFVGCELDKDYFQAMQKRVRQAMKQTNLFQSVEEKQAEQIKIF